MVPLLLLPGMMCDAQLFAPQIATLSTHRTLQIPVLTDQRSVTDLAADVLANAPPRFALAGLSMGGIVAMQMHAMAPERIDRLALLDTNPRSELTEVQQRRNSQMDRVRQGGLATVMRDEMKPNYLAEGPNRTAILDLCMNMALALGPSAFINQSLALQSRPDQTTSLDRVDVPTLIVCGAEDTLCPPERHQLMHSLIPGSRLEIVEGAGHLVTLEQPAAVNTLLQQWLDIPAAT